MSAFVDLKQTTLGRIAIVSREKREPSDTPNAPYLGLEHIEKDVGTINGYGLASEVRSTKTVFREGDLLYGKLRPYLNKVWIAEFDGICSTDILVYLKQDAVSNKFLKYRLMALDFVRYATENSSGVNLPRVNAKTLSRFPLWLPDIDEQRRIVAEIEKQFTRLDVGVAGLKRVQANLKRYRAAVLKAACEGKLVPTEAELGHEFETGEQLLERILIERRKAHEEQQKHAQRRKKYKEPVVPDTTNLPELPEGWTWANSSQVFLEVKDGTHDTPKYQPSGIPFITQKHIKPVGLVFDNYKYISIKDHMRFYQRSNPEFGDILVSMIGVNRGESCVICTNEVFSIKNVGLFKPNHLSTNVSFVQYYLSSQLGQQLILKHSKGGAQPFLGLTELRGWSIPLPPLAEQKRIVEEVDRRLSVIDEMEATVETNLKRAARLRQSILKKAFEGELV